MKKIDLAQAITILANVGVITGIIFLAVEWRQLELDFWRGMTTPELSWQ